MLTVYIPGLNREHDGAVDASRIVALAEGPCDEILVFLFNPGPPPEFDPLAHLVIHQEDECLIVLREVAGGNVVLVSRLIREGEGVLVTDVERGSPAARAGIRPGQIITMVGQQAVESPNDVADAVEAAAEAGRPSVLLMLEQRGAKRFVAVELAA